YVQEARLLLNGELIEGWGDSHTATCIDGILVVGDPGRGLGKSFILGSRSNTFHSSRYCPFVVDIRGGIKPPLTPARLPPDFRFRDELGPRWNRVQELVKKSEGRLLFKMIAEYKDQLDHEIFWALNAIYGAEVFWIPAGAIWKSIVVPASSE